MKRALFPASAQACLSLRRYRKSPRNPNSDLFVEDNKPVRQKNRPSHKRMPERRSTEVKSRAGKQNDRLTASLHAKRSWQKRVTLQGVSPRPMPSIGRHFHSFLISQSIKPRINSKVAKKITPRVHQGNLPTGGCGLDASSCEAPWPQFGVYAHE